MYIELYEKQWEALRDYWPPINMNGGSRCKDLAVINGILYVLKTGCQWPTIRTKEYEIHYSSCWRRLKRWEESGVWQQIIDKALSDAREAEMAQVALDTSVVKAKKVAYPEYYSP